MCLKSRLWSLFQPPNIFLFRQRKLNNFLQPNPISHVVSAQVKLVLRHAQAPATLLRCSAIRLTGPRRSALQPKVVVVQNPNCCALPTLVLNPGPLGLCLAAPYVASLAVDCSLVRGNGPAVAPVFFDQRFGGLSTPAAPVLRCPHSGEWPSQFTAISSLCAKSSLIRSSNSLPPNPPVIVP